MLPDAVANLVREAGGDALLLDARRARGLITDSAQVEGVCKNLRNAGFTRFIDYTAEHLGGQEFAMLLTLRHPGHAHAALTLKWKWLEQGTGNREQGTEAPGSSAVPGAEQDTAAPAPAAEETGEPDWRPREGGAARELAKDTGKMPVLPDVADNASRGAGQPGGQPQEAGPVAHPTLSQIWPAAALAEREIFEMLGIPFSNHPELRPLLLDEQFVGFPLRRDFLPPARESFAAHLLRERHEKAMLDALGGRPSLAANESRAETPALQDGGAP